MSLWLPETDALLDDPEQLSLVLSRYRRILDNDGYAFWEWDLKNQGYSCEGGFWKQLGYAAVYENVDSVDYIQEYVHPDDFDYVNNTILNHLRKNTPINMVYRVRAADGTYCWTQAAATSTRDNNDRVEIITGVNFDLSYLKETEKALRLSEARHERVLMGSNDGIWEWSATDGNENPRKAGRKGRFHTSYSCWSHLGYTEEEVDALPEAERLAIWKSHVHPYDLAIIDRQLKRYFLTRKPFDVDYRMFGDEGEIFWMRSRGHGIFNTFGRLVLFSGININVTQEKESEEHVKKAKEEAESANQIKSRFLSSMSHELRTPLNSILGFSQVLSAEESMTDEQRDNAEHINNAGQYLLRLIDDVLDLGQVEAGKMVLDNTVVMPGKIIKDCFRYFKTDIEKKSIQLKLHNVELSQSHIYVDETRLYQCLLNLISNAIKYNYQGGKVDIELNRAGQMLEIAVKDSGPGVAKDQISQLFETFNRLGAEHSDIQGSGVGLVVTKQLVELMGGTLLYSAEQERGACFKLTFPLYDFNLLEKSERQSSSKDYTAEKLPLLSLKENEFKTIVYIEDNELNTKLLQRLLQPYTQIKLLVEHDPLLGLYRVRETMPDLVLMDIHLPEISGTELMSVLRKAPKTKHIPIIALSAGAMSSDIESALYEGFDEYLTKPLDLVKLIRLFNRFFKLSHELTSAGS